jgi:hypothetical protein
MRWVMLAYRLPREPSTPRIAVWRHLRRLGVAQLADGLVALPEDPRTREQLEWLADDVIQGGGDASVWVAEPATRAQEHAIAESMSKQIDDEYAALEQEARKLGQSRDRRTTARLRRQLHRIERRDHFPGPARARARTALKPVLDSLAAA